MQPANCAFDFIAATIASERTAILRGWFGAAAPMRTNRRDVAHVERVAEPVGIGGFVVQQSLRSFVADALIDERFGEDLESS